METLLLGENQADIEKAAAILRAGGIVAFPTETVYGLGADALNPQAVGDVYAAKGRPSDNPMIVHIADLAGLYRLMKQKPDAGAAMPATFTDIEKLAAAFWPGPLTMVVARDESVPDRTTGGLDTVGVRMPSDETARALIRAAGCPIAAPSANLSGRPSPTTAQHVITDLYGRVDAIIQGKDCDHGIESTVVDMTVDPPMILRPGVITREMLSRALGKEVAVDPSLNARPARELDPEAARDAEKEDPAEPGATKPAGPKAPGMKYKHYAPKAPMTIYSGMPRKAREAMRAEAARLEAGGKKVVLIDFGYGEAGETDGAAGQAAYEIQAAHELFAALRRADEEGADAILAMAIPARGVGFAVMNRMLKSAGYHIIEVGEEDAASATPSQQETKGEQS